MSLVADAQFIQDVVPSAVDRRHSLRGAAVVRVVSPGEREVCLPDDFEFGGSWDAEDPIRIMRWALERHREGVRGCDRKYATSL